MTSSANVVAIARSRAGLPIRWGAATAGARGPVVAGLDSADERNAIGVHGGPFSLFRAVTIARNHVAATHRPNLSGTYPSVDIGPFPQWFDSAKIVSFDPWGAKVVDAFATEIANGTDIRPSIAITSACIRLPEIRHALSAGDLHADGAVLFDDGAVHATKIAIEPVWYLPGIAARWNIEEDRLRQALCAYTGGMFPDLLTRPERKVFLPPVGGVSVYVFGDVRKLGANDVQVTARVHDECTSSDVFGSDICTCRPYLAFGIAECVRAAQTGGVGIVTYERKEGRALGEVTKFLVYNARSRALQGDLPEAYFERTRQLAGIHDARPYELIADVFHWLGVRRIDRWCSMSNLKFDAMVAQGIQIRERITLPEEAVPIEARVEILAKKAAGYLS